METREPRGIASGKSRFPCRANRGLLKGVPDDRRKRCNMILNHALNFPIGLGLFLASGILPIFSATSSSAAEQRNEVYYLRGRYNNALFWRHNETSRNGSAIHFAHAILELTPLGDAASEDARTEGRYLDFLLNHKARTEPTMDYYGPYTARAMWKLYRAIDWTHIHHEQTYDIMADRGIPWDRKKEWTDRAVRYYLEKNSVARSCAPLDVTMRRAATMMKPYFGSFRNKYPKSNNFFYAAHWWHPVIYEAQILGGNGRKQDRLVRETDQVFYNEVLKQRPQRMLLSREMMPRYSRMSPESANIFDNLHMLHGIAYDILAYEGWTLEEKRAEMYRVIEAMSHQPGDEKLARKFKISRPEIDPRRYEDWMKGFDGDMNRIAASSATAADWMQTLCWWETLSASRKLRSTVKRTSLRLEFDVNSHL
jgi:hypothetical protein